MKEEGIKIRISPELKNKFKKMCDKESVSMSDKIHKFIEYQVKKIDIIDSNKTRVSINGHIYLAKKERGNKLILNLNYDSFGYLFFKKWKNEAFNKKTGAMGYAVDYKREVDFVCNDYAGVFKGVFALSTSDGYVTLVYDCEEIIN